MIYIFFEVIFFKKYFFLDRCLKIIFGLILSFFDYSRRKKKKKKKKKSHATKKSALFPPKKFSSMENPKNQQHPSIQAQVKQIATTAAELAARTEEIAAWSAARVESAADGAYRAQLQIVGGVASKLAGQRAAEVASLGAAFLADVDALREHMAQMKNVLGDVRRVGAQLGALESVIDSMLVVEGGGGGVSAATTNGNHQSQQQLGSGGIQQSSTNLGRRN